MTLSGTSTHKQGSNLGWGDLPNDVRTYYAQQLQFCLSKNKTLVAGEGETFFWAPK